MQLSLTQAAQLLGKSRRQPEYMIQQGRLKAAKDGGRWQVDEADLPLSAQQRQAVRRRADALRDTAAQVLDQTAPRVGYSMTDLQAFRAAQAIWRDATAALPAGHAGLQRLRDALDQIAVGCHRYARADKAAAYQSARDTLSQAACALLLDDAEPAAELAARIEREAIPSLGGLLRHRAG